MKKSNILGITKTYLKEIKLDEIDIQLNEEIQKNWYDDNSKIDNRVSIYKNNKGSWEGESIPIKIESIIRMLESLKKYGANYVEIMYHTDHYGYVLNGLEIRKSTEKEIEKHFNEQKRKQNIEKELIKIQKQYETKLKEITNL